VGEGRRGERGDSGRSIVRGVEKMIREGRSRAENKRRVGRGEGGSADEERKRKESEGKGRIDSRV